MDLQNAARPATARTVNRPQEIDQLAAQIDFPDSKFHASIQDFRVSLLTRKYRVSPNVVVVVAGLVFGEAR